LHLLRLAYNDCWAHESLRVRAIGTGRRWLERTPAMAAGLAERLCWLLNASVQLYQFLVAQMR